MTDSEMDTMEENSQGSADQEGDIENLLESLRERDVRVWLDGERVRVSAPSGALSAADRSQIESSKERIRLHLKRAADSVRNRPAFSAGTISGEFALSYAQQRLWFVDQLEPGNPAYNIVSSFPLAGELDKSAFSRAFNDIVRDQPSLRTVFEERDGRPVQRVMPFAELGVEFVDLSGNDAATRLSKLESIRRRTALASFNLSIGPLFRVVVISHGPSEHTVLFSVHHIVADNWSIGIVLAQLTTSYDAYREGREPEIAPLATHYGEYANSEQSRLSGQTLDQLIAYWKAKLSGAPAVLELPTDHPRPSRHTYDGSSMGFTFDEPDTEALRAFARAERVTLYPTLLAVFATMLARYAGQDDMVVGSPFANRTSTALEGVVGLFVSTLPIRVQLSHSPTGRELVQQLRENLLEAQSHQDVPFERLVQELRPARSLAVSPVFQVVFALQNTPLSSDFSVVTSGAMYDLSMFAWDSPAGISVAIEYNVNLFDRQTIQRMVGHFQRLALSLVSNPDLPVARLEMITAAERHTVTHQWNDTKTDYPRDSSIGNLFDEVVATRPDATAVINVDPSNEPLGQGSLTYRQLSDAAGRLREELRSVGVKEGSLVGIYLDRSIAAIVAMIAVLKSGAAYVPLDRRDPTIRTAELVRDANIVVRIESKDSAIDSGDRPPGVVWIDEISSYRPSALSGDSGSPRMDGNSLAYVMFTSGTTGKPKGVCVTHRNIVRLVRNTNFAEFGSDERILQFAPLAFDASTLEIWGALLNGGCLVVLPERLPSAADLGKVLDEHGITTVWLTAGFFHYMVEKELAALARVRRVLSGGDILSPKHVQQLLDAKSDGVVINGYGPTENTTFTTCHVMSPGMRLEGAVPIGRPISNTRVYILDRDGAPVPVGIAGELYAGGDGVAVGYLNNPAETQKRFLSDFTDPVGGQRLYRTGDLVRWRPDGNVEFLGRIDRQVKVRGFRIELEEVEGSLRRIPEIEDAAVIARRDATGSNVLLAYVVPRSNQMLDVAVIRTRLNDCLPDYMVPGTLVVLDALPLTPNGKLDRDALPNAEAEAQDGRIVAPRTVVETQLMAIWEKLLGQSGFGTTDNFFEIGGHSLLAIRFFSQVERIFGVRLPVSVLFQAPTVLQLAAILEQKGFNSRWCSLVAVQPDGNKVPVFMVPGLGGNVICYNQLSKQLGPDQPLYGLQSRGLDGKQLPFERIEPMASHYIDEIKRVQPRGPYRLGGSCFGGVVAYEMAQQLRSRGDDVEMLILVESWPPPRNFVVRNWLRLYATHVKFVYSSVVRNLRELASVTPKSLPAFFLTKLKVLVEIATQRDVYRGDRAQMYVDKVSNANYRAFARYVVRPYDSPLSLVIASKRVFEGPDLRVTWRKMAPNGYTEVEIPAGDSGPLLESPFVERLAAWIRGRFESVDGAVAEPGSLDLVMRRTDTNTRT